MDSFFLASYLVFLSYSEHQKAPQHALKYSLGEQKRYAGAARRKQSRCLHVFGDDPYQWECTVLLFQLEILMCDSCCLVQHVIQQTQGLICKPHSQLTWMVNLIKGKWIHETMAGTPHYSTRWSADWRIIASRRPNCDMCGRQGTTYFRYCRYGEMCRSRNVNSKSWWVIRCTLNITLASCNCVAKAKRNVRALVYAKDGY